MRSMPKKVSVDTFHTVHGSLNASAATFLVNNYKQALDIIQRNSAQLAVLRVKQPMSDDDLERYLQMETQYIDGLTTESDEVVKVAEYMEALHKAETLS